MSTVGLERAERALADLTIAELRRHRARVDDELTRRTAKASDTDELETRRTIPAPPPESER